MRTQRFVLNGLAACMVLVLSEAQAADPDPILSVHPREGVFDAPFDVRLEKAPANVEVTIRASQRDEDGALWSTVGIYRTDASGAVDAALQPSIGGSYTGTSPHGLLCSALPVGAASFASYLDTIIANPRLPTSAPRPIEPIPITLEASINGQLVAKTTAIRGDAVGVVEREVATPDGLRGVYFAPAPGREAREPVLLLNGSGGGVRRFAAARLASHGHPTFAFAIYNYADLPRTLKNFPIERVRDAAIWLANEAGTDRVAVMGVSRGSEAAAHAAIHFPEAFSAVILSVPSHLQDGGALDPDAKPGDGAWTVGGKPFPVTDLGFGMDDPRIAEQARQVPGYNASGMVLSIWGSERLEATYGTRFERITVPVLVLAGDEDATWPSWISAERIRQRMEAAGKGALVEVHSYPGAGHSMVAVGFGGPLSTFTYNPFLKGFMSFGGTPNGNCEAGFLSSRATTAFLAGVGKDHEAENDR